jgi:hypothetical protein
VAGVGMALGNVAKAKAEARINFVMVVVFPLSGFCCLENPGATLGQQSWVFRYV